MNKKNRTLILMQTELEKDIMFQAWMEHGYIADFIFKPQSKLMRALRRIWIRYKLPARGIWYGNWKKRLNNYDTLIIYSGSLTLDLPEWVYKGNSDIRIICWYWNIIDEETRPKKMINEKNVEYWSFDIKDCEKYQMNFNVQYYDISLLEIDEKIESDIYFIGHDVGRKNQILQIKEIAENQGLVCDFHIMKKGMTIPYKEVRRQLQTSKAILEINRDGQSGYTLRVMESLFFDKKLITNNKMLLNAPFYNKSNIFIIGHDNMENLGEFIELPYDKSVRKYRNEYTLETWFENFFKDERSVK